MKDKNTTITYKHLKLTRKDFIVAEPRYFLCKERMHIPKILSRRSMIGGSALAGAMTASAPFAKAAHHGNSSKGNLLNKGNTILFQGDSITDAGRNKKQEVANKQKHLEKAMPGWLLHNYLFPNPIIN